MLAPLPDTPLVTIVTPTRNQGGFIDDLVSSLDRQTYRTFEHIVVDASSTDDTIERLLGHAGRYDLQWISEPDDGMYEAVNKGWRMAKGSILAYLAADDAYLPWTIEVAVAAFRGDPQAGLVVGDVVSVFDDTMRGEVRANPRVDPGYLRRYFCLGQPAVFLRREVVDHVGAFDERLKVAGDCEFWMRAAGSFRAVKVPEVLAVDRIRTSSKRVVDSTLGAEEIARIRAPHVPAHPVARVLRTAADRGRYFASRRGTLVSLAAAEFGRRTRIPLKARWPRFVSSNVLERASLRSIAFAMLPRIGQRWERDIVRLRPISDW